MINLQGYKLTLKSSFLCSSSNNSETAILVMNQLIWFYLPGWNTVNTLSMQASKTLIAKDVWSMSWWFRKEFDFLIGTIRELEAVKLCRR